MITIMWLNTVVYFTDVNKQLYSNNFQVYINKKIISMVLWNKTDLLLISICMVAWCDASFQKPLDPFTLLRYDKRTAENQSPPPPNNEKSTSIEFDEYPVSTPKTPMRCDTAIACV